LLMVLQFYVLKEKVEVKVETSEVEAKFSTKKPKPRAYRKTQVIEPFGSFSSKSLVVLFALRMRIATAPVRKLLRPKVQMRKVNQVHFYFDAHLRSKFEP